MKDPSGFRVKTPCWGPVTRDAVRLFPSGSLSLPRTPGALTFSGKIATVTNASLFADRGRCSVGR